MSLKETFNNVKLGVYKHSPKILTAVGVIGIGATAYLTYKAAPKVEEVVKKYEDKLKTGEVSKREFVWEIVKPLALPITVGTASVACIIGSHVVLDKRLGVAQTALQAVLTEYSLLRGSIDKNLDEETKTKVLAPVEEARLINNETGEEEVWVKPSETVRLGGFWFKDSPYYTSDHSYNESVISNIKETIYMDIASKGVLPLNSVYEAFDLPKTRLGSFMGWNVSLLIDTQIVYETTLDEETGGIVKRPQIYISWTAPQDVTGKLTYNVNSRYSVF